METNRRHWLLFFASVASILALAVADLAGALPDTPWAAKAAVVAAWVSALILRLEVLTGQDINGDGRIGASPRERLEGRVATKTTPPVLIVLASLALLASCGGAVSSVEVRDPEGMIDCVVRGGPALECRGQASGTFAIVDDAGDAVLLVPGMMSIGIDTETGEAWVCPALGEGPFALAHCWRVPVRMWGADDT